MTAAVVAREAAGVKAVREGLASRASSMRPPRAWRPRPRRPVPGLVFFVNRRWLLSGGSCRLHAPRDPRRRRRRGFSTASPSWFVATVSPSRPPARSPRRRPCSRSAFPTSSWSTSRCRTARVRASEAGRGDSVDGRRRHHRPFERGHRGRGVARAAPPTTSRSLSTSPGCGPSWPTSPARRELYARGPRPARPRLRQLGRFGPMIGAASTMQPVYDAISRVAPTECHAS